MVWESRVAVVVIPVFIDSILLYYCVYLCIFFDFQFFHTHTSSIFSRNFVRLLFTRESNDKLLLLLLIIN